MPGAADEAAHQSAAASEAGLQSRALGVDAVRGSTLDSTWPAVVAELRLVLE